MTYDQLMDMSNIVNYKYIDFSDEKHSPLYTGIFPELMYNKSIAFSTDIDYFNQHQLEFQSTVFLGMDDHSEFELKATTDERADYKGNRLIPRTPITLNGRWAMIMSRGHNFTITPVNPRAKALFIHQNMELLTEWQDGYMLVGDELLTYTLWGKKLNNNSVENILSDIYHPDRNHLIIKDSRGCYKPLE
jgi:hypothetical protein